MGGGWTFFCHIWCDQSEFPAKQVMYFSHNPREIMTSLLHSESATWYLLIFKTVTRTLHNLWGEMKGKKRGTTAMLIAGCKVKNSVNWPVILYTHV